MRIYTKSAFRQGDILTADGVNTELDTGASVLGGSLTGHNMPLAAFTEAKLSNPTTASDTAFKRSSSAFNTWFRYGPYLTIQSFSTIDSVLVDGWNNVPDMESIQVDVEEGTLSGVLNICFKMETQLYSSGGLHTEVGADSYWELAVEYDGVRVAETGKMPAGTSTVCLPFTSQVAQGSVSISVKFRVSQEISGAWHLPDFEVRQRDLCLRNRKR